MNRTLNSSAKEAARAHYPGMCLWGRLNGVYNEIVGRLVQHETGDLVRLKQRYLESSDHLGAYIFLLKLKRD